MTKVTLDELIFTMSWEDPVLDRRAFELAPGARIATVASGGCNTLAFLLDDPASVVSFDYNVTQVWVTELKRQAFLKLDDAGLLELLGVRPSSRRAQLLETLMPAFDDEAQRWWKAQGWVVESGLLGGGRYERFVGLFQRLLRIIQGQTRIDALFEPRSAEERRAFYDERWDTGLWRLLFKAFFNKTVLSRRGLSPAYFTFDDGSDSFAESFARRTRHALTELNPHENPFVARYVLGRYLSEEQLPDYLRPENRELIRERAGRVEVVQGDVRDFFDRFDDGELDAICLSNVFELMSEEETAAVIPGIARALKHGRRMTLRNLMIPRSVGPGVAELSLEEGLSRDLLRDDRSFVYRSVQAYTRV